MKNINLKINFVTYYIDNYFSYTDIFMDLPFAFITFFAHFLFEKNIAKSISPGIFFY